jgi:FkbM family methyltransferase
VRTAGYATTIRFDIGEKITLNLEDWISYQIFLTGMYAVEEVQTMWFRNAVARGMIVLDIGAHVGYYTLQAAARVGSEGQVHSFEPISSSFEKLSRNIAINGFGNAMANRYIVHERSGQMSIIVGDRRNPGGSSLPSIDESDGAPQEIVDSITIDEYAERNGLREVHLAKIDVEGSELYVLKGMKNLLQRSNPKILIEFSEGALQAHGSSAPELLDFMRGLGFHPYAITTTGLREKPPGDTSREHLLLFVKTARNTD